MEPKLLTEAEAEALWNTANNKLPQDFFSELRERGLIVPEPSPLMEEAARLTDQYINDEIDEIEDLALAALKRGMELAPRVELTRDMVQEAAIRAGIYHFLTEDCAQQRRITSLHTALLEQLKEAGRGA